MPTYDTTGDLTRLLRDLDLRLRRLENRATTGTVQASSSPGGVTSGDYLLRTGDTMVGALTLNSSLTATTATFSGNVTINGTLTVAGGGYALDSTVVHRSGAETVSGIKSFTVEQRFDGGGVYADPDPGVTRAIKVGANGLAVLGGLRTDTLAVSGAASFTGTVTAAGATFSSAVIANGGVQYGAASLLDLSPVATVAATSGTGVGDKISLYANYGLGIQTNTLVAYLPATASFAVRARSATGALSSGVDALRIGSDGTLTATGLISGSAGLTVTGAISLPTRSLPGTTLQWDSITGTAAGSQAAGIGQIAAATVGSYNLADGSITTAKLSAALLVANSQIQGVDAGKFLPGTISADGIFLGPGGHVYAGPTALPISSMQARVDLNSGGIQAFDGTAKTFDLAANGSLTLKGSITAGSTITGTTLSGTSGITAGSGNNVFVAGTSGIQLGNAVFASAPFRVDMTGALTATSATITGTVTSSTITASNIGATNTVSGAALVANTVTVDKVSVGLQSSTNLILNGTFADGAAGWSTFTSVGSTLGFGATTAQAAVGTQSYFVNPAVNGGLGVSNNAVPVAAGEQYAIGAMFRAETQPGPFYLAVYFGYVENFTETQRATEVPAVPTLDLNTAGAAPSAVAGIAYLMSGSNLPAVNTWYEIRGSFTVPVNARWMRVVPVVWQNATSAWTGYVDAIWLRRQAFGTEIASGAIRTSHFVANSISGTIITTNSLTADALATGTLNASTMITAGTPGGARVEIDGRSGFAGVRLYNSTNANRFNADANAGTVTITGTINATAGTISGNMTVTGTLTGGTLSGTTVTGATVTGLLRSAASGARVEIGNSTYTRAVTFFGTSTAMAQQPRLESADSLDINGYDGSYVSLYGGRRNDVSASYSEANITVSLRGGINIATAYNGTSGQYDLGGVSIVGRTFQLRGPNGSNQFGDYGDNHQEIYSYNSIHLAQNSLAVTPSLRFNNSYNTAPGTFLQQWERQRVTATVPANGLTADVTVTYDGTFSSRPVVVATSSGTNNDQSENAYVWCRASTSTSVICRVERRAVFSTTLSAATNVEIIATL